VDSDGSKYSTYEMAQVLGILSVVDHANNDKVKILLFVTYLQIVEKTGSDLYFPYTLLAYNIPKKYATVVVSIIEPSMIYRPALLIPCPDRSEKLNCVYSAGKETIASIREIRLWGIHYVTIDRFGYDTLVDVDQIRLARPDAPNQMQDQHLNDLYAQLRALQGNAGLAEDDDENDGEVDGDVPDLDS
jgi:hypothetical protein